MATAKKTTTTKSAAKKYVVVRTYSAGVHAGFLESQDATTVVLSQVRRLWRWFGALTLNEVSISGVDSSSKVAAPAVSNTLQWIEIIECTPEAAKNLQEAKWAA